MASTFHKTCNLCEATCGVLVDVDDNRVVGIRADEDDPFSRGHICPKAIALGQVQDDPDRLRHPVRRTTSGWERISWATAFDTVSSELVRIQQEHGAEAVATYLGNPGAHNAGVFYYLSPLYNAVQSKNRYSASSLDQNPAHAASWMLFGNTLTIPIPDVDHSDFVLMFGANPIVSGGSLMTAPGIRRRLRALQERGGRLVVVDPRRTETANVADEHHFIRPGRDGLLVAALLQVIFDEGLTRKNHVWQAIDGLSALQQAVSRFRPEAVAGAVGIEAEKIRALARAFCGAESAVAYGRVGISVAAFGTLNTWLISALNIVTGNLDRPGGAMFTTPAVDLADMSRRLGAKRVTWRTRVRGAPSFNDEQPAACLAEEMLTPGEGQIRGLLTIAGNPALSAPNGTAIDRGLAGLDFFAAIDFYINETTRHADIILPPTWSLEHDNYEAVFHGFAVRNTAKYSQTVIQPEPDTRHDWQILNALAFGIAKRKAGSAIARVGWGALGAISGFFSPRRVTDWMIRVGPHGDGFRPWRRGLRVRHLEAHRKGIDLGPLQPSLSRILQTETGRIDLSAPAMFAELDRLETTMESPAGDGLLLIGRRDVRTNNSWLHNVPVTTKGRDRCTAIVHPEDAKRFHLEGAQRIAIRSRVGRIVAPFEISTDVMPGVICLPHGWGHDVEGVELSIARNHPGVNFNALSDDAVLEAVVGNAVLNGIPVEIEPTESA